MVEQIWALPADLANDAFDAPFTIFDEPDLYDILDNHTIIGYRDYLEDNQNFKQIVPYVVTQNPRGEYFSFARSGGEERLISKLSVGVGGHINLDDVIAGSYSDGVVFWGAMREIGEEFDFGRITGLGYTGIINTNEDDVSKVHMGIVLTAITDGVDWVCNEPDSFAVEECGWRSLTELMKDYDRYEAWSKILISAIL